VSAPQGSDEWRQQRCGCATASRIADILRKGKTGGASASRANYLAQLVVERLTGVPCETYQSQAMKNGIELEPQARAIYAAYFAMDTVETCGFIPHPRIEFSGASPDGLVGYNRLVQFKCPEKSKHLDTLLRGVIDTDYLTQIQWELGTTERTSCDYVSFNPEFPVSMQLWKKTILRDAIRIMELEDQVRLFLAEVAEIVDRLNRAYGEGPGLAEQLKESVG
jgi:hypothetical protein